MPRHRLRTVIVEPPSRGRRATQSGVSNDRIGCVLVFIDTDIGVTGESFLFTLGGRRIEVLETMVASLKPAIVGEDIRYAERVWDRLWRELLFPRPQGRDGLRARRDRHGLVDARARRWASRSPTCSGSP